MAKVEDSDWVAQQKQEHPQPSIYTFEEQFFMLYRGQGPLNAMRYKAEKKAAVEWFKKMLERQDFFYAQVRSDYNGAEEIRIIFGRPG